MDVHRLLVHGRKWFPLLVACVVLASVAAFVVTNLQQKTYEAKATLIVGQALSATNPDYNQLLVAQNLSATYAAVAETRPILESVITKLGLELDPDELAKHLEVVAPGDSTLLAVKAQDPVPARAADIANALAEQLIAISPTIQGREAEFQESIDQDLADTQDLIGTSQARADALLEIKDRTTEQEAELQGLEGRLASLRSTYATLLSFSSPSATNLLKVVEPAEAPTDAISPRPLLNVLLAALLGLLIAVGIAWLVEFLDDSVSSAEEVETVTGLSTVGTIGQMKSLRDPRGFYELTASLHPRSAIAEAYRSLRTNLEFAAVDAPVRSILVCSCRDGEGKTVTATNLAIVYAQAGRRVLLVDADLRKPQVHLAFDLANKVGLTTVLVVEGVRIADIAHATAQPNLTVLSTGPQPPNPAELLSSQRMHAFLRDAESAYDLILVDSPPLLAFADAAILSSMMDRTLLVIDAERSRRRAVQQVPQILTRAGANVVGVVLNRASGAAYAANALKYGSYAAGGTSPTKGVADDAP
jgi:capsular exopolysaccharide synthesis family protein